MLEVPSFDFFQYGGSLPMLIEQCFSICGPWPTGGPQCILMKVVFEVVCFRPEKPLEFWWRPFFFFGDYLFSAEKSFKCTSKLIWPENLGQVLKLNFECGPWKILKIKMGHGYKNVGKHCSRMLVGWPSSPPVVGQCLPTLAKNLLAEPEHFCVDVVRQRVWFDIIDRMLFSNLANLSSNVPFLLFWLLFIFSWGSSTNSNFHYFSCFLC